VKLFALIAGVVVVIGSLLFIDYKGYRSLKHVEEEMAALTARVDEASRLAQEEASAAAAASQRADQAAAQAELAAGGRKQAEQAKQQAELNQAQAQTAAQQASERAQQSAAQAEAIQNQLSALRQEREQELNRMQEALNRLVPTRRTAQGITIVLPDSQFRFDFDSSDLSQKNRELLSRIAGILLVSKGFGLSVFGYTDDVGTTQYNQQLSARRAKAVQDYLIQSGIEKSIINTKGYGKTSPVMQGTSETARAKNRRVEIALTDSQIRYLGEESSSSPQK
jgi:outer membrane protein OmpA-like peptidoglycan-associated protein